MKCRFLLSVQSLMITKQFIKTTKFKKIKFNKLYTNLLLLAALTNKSSLFFKNSKYLKPCLLGFNLTKRFIYLFKLQKIKYTHFSFFFFFFSFEIFQFFKNLYFITDLRFKLFWFNNLIRFSLSFYRFSFLLFNNKNISYLSLFNVQLFNRFKKTRKKFITFFLKHTPSQTVIISDSLNPMSTNFENNTILNIKSKSFFYSQSFSKFFYNYWYYLKVFLGQKISKNKINNNNIFFF